MVIINITYWSDAPFIKPGLHSSLLTQTVHFSRFKGQKLSALVMSHTEDSQKSQIRAEICDLWKWEWSMKISPQWIKSCGTDSELVFRRSRLPTPKSCDNYSCTHSDMCKMVEVYVGVFAQLSEWIHKISWGLQPHLIFQDTFERRISFKLSIQWALWKSWSGKTHWCK